MKALLSLTRQFFAQIWADAMVAALLFVPLIMGFVFRFGVPALEGYLCARLAKASILAPYYPVFDLLLAALTPLMFTAAGALVILDEADAGLCRAIAVTPVGKSGYLLSHIGIPAAAATLYCALIMAVFDLSGLDTVHILLLSLCSGALGVVVALMIPVCAKNKVEGMAYAKLSGLFTLGIPAALLLPPPTQYVAGFLPTLWMSKLVMDGALWYALPALLTAALWSGFFLQKFRRKLL